MSQISKVLGLSSFFDKNRQHRGTFESRSFEKVVFLQKCKKLQNANGRIQLGINLLSFFAKFLPKVFLFPPPFVS